MENFKLQLKTATSLTIGYLITLTFFYFGYIQDVAIMANFFIAGACVSTMGLGLLILSLNDTDNIIKLVELRIKLGNAYMFLTGALSVIKQLGLLVFFIATGNWVLAVMGAIAIIASTIFTIAIKAATKEYLKTKVVENV